ncbi:thioesterase II family protein [Streptomyces globosus]|jgi:surfactin synthase thioesterase subunit|uniref:thioesterase II family protein n=1 Tax=Streptomyces sp. WAC05292 TaxID=2487418 RepID=UPI000F74A6AB|nr:alpha/beta fold hydrolase [Streptomyces sp. WAC05292]RSS83412.1 thioesterase [Streptomyces sp. WAC05292]
MAVRLHCFAHAGAGDSAFRRWSRSTGSGVDTIAWPLPGRDRRRREPRVTTREALLADLGPLFEHIADEPGVPYVLYGHSLGATIAYTVARALRQTGLPQPALLAVGACPPPGTPAVLAAAAELPDAELLAVLDRYGAAPPDARPGDVWHRHVMPVLRDDLRLALALRAAADGPVDVPLLAVGGADDRLADADALAAWGDWTTGRFVQRTLPGGHFFVRDRELPRLLGRAARVVRRGRAQQQQQQQQQEAQRQQQDREQGGTR